ncbi:uncharacterized protein MYCFIDRAFT_216247 [Pseudocercospora fijiensis CIRAD86]|uniref:Uncharacterized protein n=1 Tax=Pseudocercospora fijiensis (strain CIRAD86) TaxID=383855 RepID=M3ATM2_PSEFD|nr:uncharacterized protein MYCFIDRAFT_216247 [Pseudocercospora fijiensis CIRAD86]EME80508.1 hypothetical protein MYCFIDRAFT_216247 [Pseudocercospora fijiensis CIRAD86]
MPKRTSTPTPSVVDRLAKRSKRRAYETLKIKNESDDSSDVDADAAPQEAQHVGSDPSILPSPSSPPKPGSQVQESGDDECKVIAFPNAAGITEEELLKCWIQYALNQSDGETLDCSTWLHSQATVLGGDHSILDRLFKHSPPAEMLQTICDKLGKRIESARPGGVQARVFQSQTLEAATAPAEASATQDANAAFDPARYKSKSLDKIGRVEMAKAHFPTAQSLFLFHAKANSAISIKIASNGVQSVEPLLHETWSRLSADSRSEWEQLLFRLHKDGLKKPVGPAGQQLLEQQAAVGIVAAVIAGSDTLQASSSAEALTNQPGPQSTVPREVKQNRTATRSLDCVWSFDDVRFSQLSQEERSVVAKAHFPTGLHLLAYHLRMHQATSGLVDWQDSDQVSHRLSQVWQTLPWPVQKSWELRLSDLHNTGVKKVLSTKSRKSLEHKIKPILMKFISEHADPLDAELVAADKPGDSACKTSRSAAGFPREPHAGQRKVDTLPSDADTVHKSTVLVDFVTWTRKPGFYYVLLLVNTPQFPIADATRAEVEECCRAAYEGLASVVELRPLSSQAWGVCLRAYDANSANHQGQLLGRHMFLRGFKLISNHLPSCPTSVFSASISRHLDLDATRLLRKLRREMSRRGLPAPTLLDQRNGTRRRLLVYFPKPPNLFGFYIPIMVQGMTAPYNVFFRSFDQNTRCWICRIVHGGQVCPMALAVTASYIVHVFVTLSISRYREYGTRPTYRTPLLELAQILTYMQPSRSLALIDEIAERSKQTACMQFGIKSEPEEPSAQPEMAPPRPHPEEEREDEEEEDEEAQADDEGNDSDGSYTPTAKRKKAPKKPTANGRKRRQISSGSARRRSDPAERGPPGPSTEQPAAATSTSSSKQPSMIEVCLQNVATMPEDWPIVAEAIKILVHHRLPSAASVQSYEDLATWAGTYECMRKYDADTFEHVVDVLTSAEAKCIVDVLVNTFRSPKIIQAIDRTLGEHVRVRRAASGAVLP